jgi:hypothetical protein
MKNILLVIFIGFSFYSTAQNPAFKNFIGKDYSVFSEFEAFSKFNDYGGLLLKHSFGKDTSEAFAL